jgi:hypothetical protein
VLLGKGTIEAVEGTVQLSDNNVLGFLGQDNAGLAIPVLRRGGHMIEGQAYMTDT